MKRFIITTLFSIVILPLFSIVINAAPTSYDVFSCDVNTNSFTVDVLSRSGGQIMYDSKACYQGNQFSSAIAKMNELVTLGNKDVVVRYLKTDVSDFYSPLRIVAASRAMAYTQNETYALQSTLNIHSLVTLNSAVNYTDNSEPLVYYETNVSNQSSGIFNPSNLVAYIQLNGQFGYVPLKMIDIIPFIYVENSILTPYYIRVSETQPLVFYHRPGRDPGIIPEPVNYTVVNGEIRIYIDRATTGGSLIYSKAPSWLPSGTYYSPNGIHFYTDLDLKNPVLNGSEIGEFYTYYAYLNFRSKSNYTGTELNTFLNNYFTSNSINPTSSVMTNQGDVFVNSQNTYGMNALLFYAFAIHESAYGRSSIAVSKLNLFGYGAYDSNTSNAATYASVQEGVERHMGIQMRFYLDYFNNNRFYSSNLGNKGVGINTKYASDPYWNVKIAGHAYRIDKALGSKDLDHYQLAILSEENRTIYSNRNLSTTLTTINTRAKNYPVILNNVMNNNYQINTSNPISNGSFVTSSNTSLVPYSFENSVAYVSNTQVKLINTSKNAVVNLDPPPLETDSSMSYVVSFDWNESDLMSIKGFSALRNTNMQINETTHTLIITSLIDNSIKFEHLLELDTPLYSISLPNGYDYTKAWFKGDIDIKSLPDGYYKFEILTQSGPTSARFNLINTATTPIASLKSIDGNDYRFIHNNFKRMAYELIKEKGIIVENQSSTLQSRFTSFGLISNFEIQVVEERDILNIKGLSLMQHLNQGASDNISHKLMLVDSTGLQYIYDLNTTTNNVVVKQDPNFTYTHVWFENTNIDITDLPVENYRLYSIISNQAYTDVVELIDYAFIGNKEFTFVSSIYNLNANTFVRNRFELTKSVE